MTTPNALPNTASFIGPTCKPRVSISEEGSFIDFRRMCSHPACDVNLTSANRWEKRVLCIEHGREMLREKAARRRRAAGVPTRAEMLALRSAIRSSLRSTAAPAPTPLVDSAPRPPAAPQAQEAKKAAAMERELKALLRQAIPPPPPKPHRTIGLVRDPDFELKVLLRQAIPLCSPDAV